MFFSFTQNNSGGYFVEDEKVAHYVIIEADSEEEADKRFFDDLDLNYGGYCPCCGSRWSGTYDDKGFEQPSVYGEPVEITTRDDHNGYIYYKDGTQKKFRR